MDWLTPFVNDYIRYGSITRSAKKNKAAKRGSRWTKFEKKKA